jgi:hypothetical protein
VYFYFSYTYLIKQINMFTTAYSNNSRVSTRSTSPPPLIKRKPDPNNNNKTTETKPITDLNITKYHSEFKSWFSFASSRFLERAHHGLQQQNNNITNNTVPFNEQHDQRLDILSKVLLVFNLVSFLWSTYHVIIALLSPVNAILTLPTLIIFLSAPSLVRAKYSLIKLPYQHQLFRHRDEFSAQISFALLVGWSILCSQDLQLPLPYWNSYFGYSTTDIGQQQQPMMMRCAISNRCVWTELNDKHDLLSCTPCIIKFSASHGIKMNPTLYVSSLVLLTFSVISTTVCLYIAYYYIIVDGYNWIMVLSIFPIVGFKELAITHVPRAWAPVSLLIQDILDHTRPISTSGLPKQYQNLQYQQQYPLKLPNPPSIEEIVTNINNSTTSWVAYLHQVRNRYEFIEDECNTVIVGVFDRERAAIACGCAAELRANTVAFNWIWQSQDFDWNNINHLRIAFRNYVQAVKDLGSFLDNNASNSDGAEWAKALTNHHISREKLMWFTESRYTERFGHRLEVDCSCNELTTTMDSARAKFDLGITSVQQWRNQVKSTIVNYSNRDKILSPSVSSSRVRNSRTNNKPNNAIHAHKLSSFFIGFLFIYKSSVCCFICYDLYLRFFYSLQMITLCHIIVVCLVVSIEFGSATAFTTTTKHVGVAVFFALLWWYPNALSIHPILWSNENNLPVHKCSTGGFGQCEWIPINITCSNLCQSMMVLTHNEKNYKDYNINNIKVLTSVATANVKYLVLLASVGTCIACVVFDLYSSSSSSILFPVRLIMDNIVGVVVGISMMLRFVLAITLFMPLIPFELGKVFVYDPFMERGGKPSIYIRNCWRRFYQVATSKKKVATTNKKAPRIVSPTFAEIEVSSRQGYVAYIHTRQEKFDCNVHCVCFGESKATTMVVGIVSEILFNVKRLFETRNNQEYSDENLKNLKRVLTVFDAYLNVTRKLENLMFKNENYEWENDSILNDMQLKRDQFLELLDADYYGFKLEMLPCPYQQKLIMTTSESVINYGRDLNLVEKWMIENSFA